MAAINFGKMIHFSDDLKGEAAMNISDSMNQLANLVIGGGGYEHCPMSRKQG
ncbi:MAG: hypothetical protein Q9170_008197 [Blastenia crenularia]